MASEPWKFPSLWNHAVYYTGFDMLDHLAATIPVFDSRRALSLMSWDMDAHARVRVCSTPASACARVSVAAFSKSSGRASPTPDPRPPTPERTAGVCAKAPWDMINHLAATIPGARAYQHHMRSFRAHAHPPSSSCLRSFRRSHEINLVCSVAVL